MLKTRSKIYNRLKYYFVTAISIVYEYKYDLKVLSKHLTQILLPGLKKDSLA